MDAKFIRKLSFDEGWRGDASLYELTPPKVTDDHPDGISHVAVSTASTPMGVQTIVFPADPAGYVSPFSQNIGSPMYNLDPVVKERLALEGMGYKIPEAISG